MNKRSIYGYLSMTFAVFAFLGFGIKTLFAETLPSGAFIVQPAKVEVVLLPGEEKTVMLRLTNGTPVPLHVETSFEDVASNVQISPTEDPVRLLGNEQGANSLQDSLSLSRTSFDLLSQKEVIVPVRIRIPEKILPGGRYGSVVFSFRSALPPGLREEANVSVSNRVAVLFYVRIEGKVKEEGKLAAFGLFNDAKVASAPSLLEPLRFQVAFENTGDVYVNPHGAITVTGMFGKEYHVAVDPFAVLPGATRMREIDVHDELSSGYYSARLLLARGYGDAIDTSEVHFWILPTLGSALLWIAGLVLLFFLIRRSLRISHSAIN